MSGDYTEKTLDEALEGGDDEFEKNHDWDPVLEEWVQKGRRYISDPSEAPEDAEVQEGEQGGMYYEVSDGGGGEGMEGTSHGGDTGGDGGGEGAPSPTDTIPILEDELGSAFWAMGESLDIDNPEDITEVATFMNDDARAELAQGNPARAAVEGGGTPTPTLTTFQLDGMSEEEQQEVADYLDMDQFSDDITEIASRLGDEERETLASEGVEGLVGGGSDGADELVGQIDGPYRDAVEQSEVAQEALPQMAEHADEELAVEYMEEALHQDGNYFDRFDSAEDLVNDFDLFVDSLWSG